VTSGTTAAATAQVSYTYDDPSVSYSIGRLTKVANGNTWQILSYDPLGRPISSSQTTNSSTHTFPAYTYNRTDKLTSIQYPSGRAVNTTYDLADRISGVSGVSGTTTTNYAPSVTYASNGGISVMALRNSQMTEQWCYNNRLQPTGVRLGSAANGANVCSNPGSDLLNLAYSYGTTNNNGNLVSQTIARPGQSWTESYPNYDGINRLTAASEASGWSQTYGYDNFGNRAVLTGVVNSYATPTAISQYANNRWNGNGTGYDSAGNQTALPYRTFTYDAENRLVASTQPNTAAISYSYDGDGRRAMKNVGGAITIYVYDAQGQLAAEYGAATDSGTNYLTGDHLGSTRLVTDANGVIKKCYDYFPFGEDIASGTGGRTSCFGNGAYPSTPDVLADKFTGKERDAETGLDYFGARYFSGPEGRFTSPDKPFAGQNPSNPQSWNLYSYGLNSPLRYIDPTGRDPEAADPSDNGSDCGKNMKDCGPQIRPLPQTTLGQTQDRIIGAGQGVANTLLDLAHLLGAPEANIQQIRDFLHLDPSSENQKFGAELGCILGMLLPGGEAGTAGELLETASSAKSGLNLTKSLASEQQMAEILSGAGQIIAGPGARTALRDASRLTVDYGGAPVTG
jgi:RHS repeat-associated protein